VTDLLLSRRPVQRWDIDAALRRPGRFDRTVDDRHARLRGGATRDPAVDRALVQFGPGVAMFANEGGAHDDLVAYFRDHPHD
jgi:hypothetical protein